MQQAATYPLHQTRPVSQMRPLERLKTTRSIRLPNQDTGHYPIVACSTTFAHNSNIVPDPPDLILVSSDGVHFYVHSQQLLGESANQLNSLLSPEGEHDYNRLITLPEPSTVVNVILHTMYGISCTPYHPSALTVIAAITALPKYGVTLKQCIVPGMPLYATALESLPCEPIEFYTLAAEHELHPLAVEASTHMGDFSIMSIPDEQVERMGVMYYKKLVAMAEGRADMVKRLTRAQPEAHPPTPSCTEEDQQLMRTSWTILVSEFAWDRLRFKSSEAIMAKMGTLRDMLMCEDCERSVAARLQTLQIQLAELDRQRSV